MNLERLMKLAFLNNDVIYSSLAQTPEGIPNIDPLRVSDGNIPLIEFHQIGGADAMIVDDEVFRERYTYQIVYVTEEKDFGDIRSAMKESMRQLGFIVTSEYSVQNRYTNLVHYYIHVSQSFDEVWYQHKLDEQLAIYNKKHPEPEATDLPEGEYYDPKTGERTLLFNEDEFEIIE